MRGLDIENTTVTFLAHLVPLQKWETSGRLTSWWHGLTVRRIRKGPANRYVGGQTSPPLLQVAHGGSPPSVADEDLNVWLAKMSQSARFLRWLAASQFPELYAGFIAKRKDGPDNSTVADFWQTVEDWVLSYIEDYFHGQASAASRRFRENPWLEGSVERYVLDETGLQVTLA